MPKIDLNAPAFGDKAQKVSELVSEDTKEEVLPEEAEKETVETSEEESKVPYSRFKKFHDAAKEAAEEAAYWKAKAEAIKEEPIRYNSELPDQWKKLYGDDEKSKEAWAVQQDLNRQIKEEALREAREAVRNERFEEQQRIEENVETLDSGFDDLSALVGRDLTEKEQSAILDIVDDYTPKDRNGDYAGAILPFEKAWEIYELKNQSAKSSTIKARNNVAALSGSQTQSESSSTEKELRDKNFNPLNWNAYKERI